MRRSSQHWVLPASASGLLLFCLPVWLLVDCISQPLPPRRNWAIPALRALERLSWKILLARKSALEPGPRGLGGGRAGDRRCCQNQNFTKPQINGLPKYSILGLPPVLSRLNILPLRVHTQLPPRMTSVITPNLRLRRVLAVVTQLDSHTEQTGEGWLRVALAFVCVRGDLESERESWHSCVVHSTPYRGRGFTPFPQKSRWRAGSSVTFALRTRSLMLCFMLQCGGGLIHAVTCMQCECRLPGLLAALSLRWTA